MFEPLTPLFQREPPHASPVDILAIIERKAPDALDRKIIFRGDSFIGAAGKNLPGDLFIPYGVLGSACHCLFFST